MFDKLRHCAWGCQSHSTKVLLHGCMIATFTPGIGLSQASVQNRKVLWLGLTATADMKGFDRKLLVGRICRTESVCARQVLGTLPRELDGIFIRNGPNPRFPPDGPGNYHWWVTAALSRKHTL